MKRMCNIHSWPYMNVTNDLKVNIIRFLTWICVQTVTSLFFAIDLPYLVHGCITMIRCVKYSVCVHPSVFADSCGAWCRHTIWHMGVSPVHRTMLCIPSWPVYYLELWPQGKSYKFYNIDSCPGHKFFDLFYRHAIFGTWVYHYETICQVLCFSVRLSV